MEINNIWNKLKQPFKAIINNKENTRNSLFSGIKYGFKAGLFLNQLNINPFQINNHCNNGTFAILGSIIPFVSMSLDESSLIITKRTKLGMFAIGFNASMFITNLIFKNKNIFYKNCLYGLFAIYYFNKFLLFFDSPSKTYF